MDYDFHGGKYEEIEKHCQRIRQPTDKVHYLEWALAELEKLILDEQYEAIRIARSLYPDLPQEDGALYDKAEHLNLKRKLQRDLRYWIDRKTQEKTETRREIDGSSLSADESIGQDYWSITQEECKKYIEENRKASKSLDKDQLDKRRFEDFKKIMFQLSMADNKFVNPVSYQDAESIFKGYFADHRQPIDPDPHHRIDWIGTGPAYEVFHKLLLETNRISNYQHSVFFAAHFTKNTKVVNDRKKIADWSRDRRINPAIPSEDAKKLKTILSY